LEAPEQINPLDGILLEDAGHSDSGSQPQARRSLGEGGSTLNSQLSSSLPPFAFLWKHFPIDCRSSATVVSSSISPATAGRPAINHQVTKTPRGTFHPQIAQMTQIKNSPSVKSMKSADRILSFLLLRVLVFHPFSLSVKSVKSVDKAPCFLCVFVAWW
jgi:hypothetical protein